MMFVGIDIANRSATGEDERRAGQDKTRGGQDPVTEPGHRVHSPGTSQCVQGWSARQEDKRRTTAGQEKDKRRTRPGHRAQERGQSVWPAVFSKIEPYITCWNLTRCQQVLTQVIRLDTFTP